MPGNAFIGTSGYSYRHWAGGVFYPPDLPQGKWLEYYARTFSTVELNVTFYRLPGEKVFNGWRSRTPEQFLFAAKGSRLITHVKKLAECTGPLARLLDRCTLLGDKLGVMLWQFPPSFERDIHALASFLRLLEGSGVRHAFEFRNPTWFCPEVYEALKRAGYTFCREDRTGREEDVPEEFAFIYVRRHGDTAEEAGCYSTARIEKEAARVRSWTAAGKDVFVYFNNDLRGYAVKNAALLKKLVEAPAR